MQPPFQIAGASRKESLRGERSHRPAVQHRHLRRFRRVDRRGDVALPPAADHRLPRHRGDHRPQHRPEVHHQPGEHLDRGRDRPHPVALRHRPRDRPAQDGLWRRRGPAHRRTAGPDLRRAWARVLLPVRGAERTAQLRAALPRGVHEPLEHAGSRQDPERQVRARHAARPDHAGRAGYPGPLGGRHARGAAKPPHPQPRPAPRFAVAWRAACGRWFRRREICAAAHVPNGRKGP